MTKYSGTILVDDSGNGKIVDRQRMVDFIKKFPGKKLTIEVRLKRSLPQNNTWWMYMSILSEHLGFTPDEMNEICKFKFLRQESVCEKTGEVLPFIKSTKDLSVSEMNNLFEQLKVWAAQSFHVSLPDPNDQIDLFDE